MAGKADIAERISDAVGITKKQAAEAFDACFSAITDCLCDDERVQVPGFGSFSVSERAARTGRNPATGATIQIPASKNAKFKPSKDLKDALN